MTQSRLVVALVALLGAAVLAAPASGAAEPQLKDLEGARFPDRAFVLTLPTKASLDPASVVVRENGDGVSGLSVVPATAAGDGDFAVVLVIDASGSMRGRAIAGAMEAAQMFADRRSPQQALGLVAFNDVPAVVLRPTTSQEAIEDALASAPRLAYRTHIYDAVDEALSLLHAADATVGSVVVLSDGADTGSRKRAADVLARARRDGVRVFSVGLRSKSFDPGALSRLADATGGRYAEASRVDDLGPVFQALGGRLAREYLVRYRSEAPPQTRVHVAARVDGIPGIAVSEYTTPAPGATSAPFQRPLVERFVESVLGMIVTTLFVALLVGAGVMVLIRPRPRTLRRRLGEFVSVALGDARKTANATDLVLARAEERVADKHWWGRFRDELELAGIAIAPVQIVLWTLGGTLLVGSLGFLVAGPLFAVLGLVVPFVVRALIKRRVEKKRNLFAEQLPENLQVISSALRAGHTLTGALSVLVEDCAEPSRSEFRRVVADEQLGAPLEETLVAVARRMRNRDLEQVALVATLQRETGGNTAEVLERVAETVRGRFEIRRLVRTLTTQGRMSRWVLTLLPVGLLVLMTLINPAYVAPLFQETLGRVLLLVAGLMVMAGSFVIKRIVDIKV